MSVEYRRTAKFWWGDSIGKVHLEDREGDNIKIDLRKIDLRM
jgi:hypothetical protein